MAAKLLPQKLWELVEPFIPTTRAKPRGGRPRLSDRACLAGIVSYNLPASSGIARILRLDPDRHVSYIAQSVQVTTSRAQLVKGKWTACYVKSPLERWGWPSIARQRRASQGSRRTARAIAAPVADHLSKCSFTIPAEKGRNVLLGDQPCGIRTLEKGKGCDIGYALAISSCEEANSVETCTVTALDAITAFAVPNPNSSSQSRRFFQVWLPVGLPFRADHSAYFGLAKV
jgi:hypothetical protein